MYTCCMGTCDWAGMCCWGLRTPVAYLYWGTPRTGAAAAAAEAGRGPIGWAVARTGDRSIKTNIADIKCNCIWYAVRRLLEWRWLTETLGGHHSGNLGGRPHGTEGLRAWCWGTHRPWHALEFYEHTKTEWRCYSACLLRFRITINVQKDWRKLKKGLDTDVVAGHLG